MSIVLDASVTIARLNHKEITSKVLDVFDCLSQEAAFVPSLWWLEVANALTMSLRRKRITADDRTSFLDAFAALPVRTDNRPVQHTWPAALSLCDRHGLTVYDAAYLELALYRKLPLATLDTELRAAATAEKVPLLGL